VLQLSKTGTLLGTLLLAFAFPVLAQTYGGENPRVLVSVYDDVGVPARMLVRAEQEAAKIFEHAGLHVVWKNCSSSGKHVELDGLVRVGDPSWPGSESDHSRRVGVPASGWSGSENVDCARFDWPTHLAVRVVPHSRASMNEVFGVAFLSAEGKGCYSVVFYDRAAELQTAWNIRLADILGNVMAHELGHLLLGSNSHVSAGIMRAWWQGKELSQMARGNLLFTTEQGEHMRRKLGAAYAALGVTTQSTY
jgi:hypothetical protein